MGAPSFPSAMRGSPPSRRLAPKSPEQAQAAPFVAPVMLEAHGRRGRVAEDSRVQGEALDRLADHGLVPGDGVEGDPQARRQRPFGRVASRSSRRFDRPGDVDGQAADDQQVHRTRQFDGPDIIGHP